MGMDWSPMVLPTRLLAGLNTSPSARSPWCRIAA